MIQQKKVHYPVTENLLGYLKPFRRCSPIPLVYNDLRGFSGAVPYEDPHGNETLWLSVIYPPEIMAELRPRLTEIYAVLKIGGDLSRAEHLSVERVDFGDFGNSKPFRIRITNQFNGNSDYYYVKQADSSRIYGLELEHILSPNRMNYLVNGNTLIEEHIAGVPGDVFLREYLPQPELNKVRIAKEFTKFNERCFLRLLGDMRSVNYVVDITPDFEEVQYRVRPHRFRPAVLRGGGQDLHGLPVRLEPIDHPPGLQGAQPQGHRPVCRGRAGPDGPPGPGRGAAAHGLAPGHAQGGAGPARARGPAARTAQRPPRDLRLRPLPDHG